MNTKPRNPVFFTAALILLMLGTSLTGTSAGGEDSFTGKDRELLIRIDERLNQIDKRFEQVDKRFEQVDRRIDELRQDINKRFEQIDKRFEQVDKRFEQVDKRFEQVDKRIGDLVTLMTGIIAAFGAIVALSIGFAIWDRRTMIRPFEDKVRKIEDDILNDRKKLNQLFDALRKFAAKNKEFAEILKTFSIL